jgi:DNA-directed RNA polymerase delta subunit
MWAEELEEGFLVHVAKSIAYDKMKKGDFQTLVNRIDDVLQKELGVGLTELKISALEDAK